ncbi:putative protease YhbU [bioreactor metagenome]|uniref:Putative protease YhbU n=1 Tax=bioreactor metagenome TaxID=1076179 RepID=A0A644XW08_9ZZZZ
MVCAPRSDSHTALDTLGVALRAAPELSCPAGNLETLKAAVDAGADCVYVGLRNATNARNFPGLNFDERALLQGVDYAHSMRCKVHLVLNTYPQASAPEPWHAALDRAALWEVDAVILADPGLMRRAAQRHPDLPVHLSVQSGVTNAAAINLYQRQFNIQRAMLPRMLSLQQVRDVVQNISVGVEVFAFGSLCVMVEGRCALSSYVTGDSPHTTGACSPQKYARWQTSPDGEESRLNGWLIDRSEAGGDTGYPVLCKGRFDAGDTHNYHAFDAPERINALEMLPQWISMGVRAVRIEGRQRSPAYVEQVTRIWRQAIDQCMEQAPPRPPQPAWIAALEAIDRDHPRDRDVHRISWS